MECNTITQFEEKIEIVTSSQVRNRVRFSCNFEIPLSIHIDPQMIFDAQIKEECILQGTHREYGCETPPYLQASS